jgi:histidine triad (HIT) family protein
MAHVDCIFCAIAHKKIKADIVSETDQVIAFHDINKIAPFHLLIIPKVHLTSMNDISDENAGTMTDMMLLAKNLARKFDVDKSGYRIVINTGKDAGQTVFHLHIHLLGGRSFSWPPG